MDDFGFNENTERDFGDVIKRLDVTYVITENGSPYSVKQENPLFLEVEAYAAANPEKVTQEQAPSLADVKAAKKAEINAAKWDDITNGDVEYADLHFHTDQTSQGMIGNAVQLHGAVGALPAIWRAKDGYLTVTNVSQLVAIGGLIAARIEDLFEREHILEGDIDAANTVEEVQAIVWQTSSV